MLTITPAAPADRDAALAIYAGARAFMAAHGNPTQWAGGYPPPEQVDADIREGRLYLAREDGAVQGNVFGTYLHGVLDSGELLGRLWEGLARRKGLDPGEAPAFDPVRRREAEYDKLADALRRSLDMDLIYRILEEGL